MDNQYSVRIQLVLMGHDWRSTEGKRYVVSLHPMKIKLPTVDLTGDINKLFNKYVDIDINWVNLRILGCVTDHEKKTLDLIFGCVIPFDTTLRPDTQWVEFDVHNTSLTSQLISIMRNL